MKGSEEDEDGEVLVIRVVGVEVEVAVAILGGGRRWPGCYNILFLARRIRSGVTFSVGWVG